MDMVCMESSSLLKYFENILSNILSDKDALNVREPQTAVIIFTNKSEACNDISMSSFRKKRSIDLIS